MTTPIKVSKVPTEFDEGAGDWLMVMQVSGIATHHQVWLDVQLGDYYYFVAPESGPVNWLRDWARSAQEVLVWTSSKKGWYDSDAWKSASEHCLAEATKEVEENSR